MLFRLNGVFAADGVVVVVLGFLVVPSAGVSTLLDAEDDDNDEDN